MGSIDNPSPHGHPSPARRPAARIAAVGLTALARALTGARSFWAGCAPEPRQRVYFANHTSHTDFLLLWASLPPELRAITRPVAGADYWQASRLRRFIIQDVFNGVLVQRSQPASDDDHAARVQAAASSLQPLHDALAQGHSLIIFPEGTRNLGDELLPFKSGIYHLAKAWPQVEFVPVWLENLHRVMPKGHVIPLPLLCTVTFGAPVPLQPNDATDPKTLYLQRCRNALQALKPIRN